MKNTNMIGMVLLVALALSAAPVENGYPMRQNGCGLPVISATVDKFPATLVIDTGASFTRVSKRYNIGQPVIHLRIGGSLFKVMPRFRDFSKENRACGPLDGFIGNDILSARGQVILDYENGSVTFVEMAQ